MDLEDNNVNGEIARKRDIFLEAEKEYLDELKKDPKNLEFIVRLNKFNALDLSKEADRMINWIENGEVSAENLEKIEAEIVLIYAAIEDKIKEKVREKERSFEEPKRQISYSMKQKNMDEDELEI